MAVYVVALLDITDRDRYAQYEAGFMAVFRKHGGRMLAVDEPVAAGRPAAQDAPG